MFIPRFRPLLPLLIFSSLIASTAAADGNDEVRVPSAPSAPSAGADDAEEHLPAHVLLAAPREPATWALAPMPFAPSGPRSPNATVVVDRHDATIFAGRGVSHGRGRLREGARLPAEIVGTGPERCGRRLALGNGGYVCTHFGVDIIRGDAIERPAQPESLSLDAPLPYRYGVVVDRSARRYDELPTQRQLERLADGVELPGLVDTVLDGDYFVALADQVEGPRGPYWRTVAGRFVRADAVEPIEASSLAGEYDAAGLTLPLAFVFRREVGVRRVVARELRLIGRAERYARFAVDAEVARPDGIFVVGGEGIYIERDDVRIARRHARPAGVPAGARWIHIDLDQQILVAYEDQTPVFATLVATGKEGYDTPSGLFRVAHKYLSTTMSGDDPNDGVYDVAEVPWTQYYDGSYALHGAYWHDAFGEVRSHGCTNIAPLDARFLFSWTTPQLPAGWHGAWGQDGTWISLTRAGES